MKWIVHIKMNSKMKKVVLRDVVRPKSFWIGRLINHMNQIQVIAIDACSTCYHKDHEQVKNSKQRGG